MNSRLKQTARTMMHHKDPAYEEPDYSEWSLESLQEEAEGCDIVSQDLQDAITMAEYMKYRKERFAVLKARRISFYRWAKVGKSRRRKFRGIGQASGGSAGAGEDKREEIA